SSLFSSSRAVAISFMSTSPDKKDPAKDGDWEKKKTAIFNEFIRCLSSPAHAYGKLFSFKYTDLIQVLINIKRTLAKEPPLVHCPYPCVVVGDIRGQFTDLSYFFKYFAKDEKPGWLCQRYVFLGNYVDSAKQSIECVVFLFLLKIRFPKSIFLLRGSNECKDVNRELDFRQSFEERLGKDKGADMFHMFNEAFTHLPLACLIGTHILCVHGGISPKLTSLDDINKIPKPLNDPTEDDLACDLLWSEPMLRLKGFKPKDPLGVNFGRDVLESTMKALNVRLMFRGHQVMRNGFSTSFGTVITLYSAPSYTEQPKPGTKQAPPQPGAALYINKRAQMGFKILSHGRGEQSFCKDHDEANKGKDYEESVDDDDNK
ncbi:hypothetical protein PFISCL1PPCAC_8855, partial [Pristionchus fissidentatus]